MEIFTSQRRQIKERRCSSTAKWIIGRSPGNICSPVLSWKNNTDLKGLEHISQLFGETHLCTAHHRSLKCTAKAEQPQSFMDISWGKWTVHGTEGLHRRWHWTDFHNLFCISQLLMPLLFFLNPSSLPQFPIHPIHPSVSTRLQCTCASTLSPLHLLSFSLYQKKRKKNRVKRFGWTSASKGPTSQCKP